LALGAIGLAARLRYIQQVKYKKMV
jgi:hypothetical protein